MHPSHSVNYHEGDIEKRTRLLRSIAQACRNLHVADHVMLFRCITCGNRNEVFRPRQLAESQRDTRWVEILIWALIELCFRPRHRLPNAGLLTNGFYRLEDWHNNYFAHVLSLPSAKSNQVEKIAATIIPLFKRLNKCLKTNSWYLHAYEANWGGIVSALADGLAVLEGVCDLLDQNHFSPVCSVEHGSYNEKDDVDLILSHGERITFRIAALIHERYPQPQRNLKWIGFAE